MPKHSNIPCWRLRFPIVQSPFTVLAHQSYCTLYHATAWPSKAKKSGRTPCLFRAVCPFRLGSSQAFSCPGKRCGVTVLAGTLGRSHSKPIQVHDPNCCSTSSTYDTFQDSVPLGVKSGDIPRVEGKGGTSDLQVQRYLRGKKRVRETP